MDSPHREECHDQGKEEANLAYEKVSGSKNL